MRVHAVRYAHRDGRRSHLAEDRPFAIVHSLPDMYGVFDRLRALAGGDEASIVPGHDPLVLDRHPAVSPAMDGLAVAIC
jgi:hypothetical protein